MRRPYKIVFCVRKNIGTLTCSSTGSYFAIKNISSNLYSQVGLSEFNGSGAALHKLHPERTGRYEVGRILWLSGIMLRGKSNPFATAAIWALHGTREKTRGGLGRSAPRNPIRARNGLHLDTQLCRSHQLTDELVALGPLGGSSLQLQVTADNNQNTTWLSSEYELVVVVMASGIFGHERDTSSTFLGLNRTRNMLCDNSPTVVTRSAEWSAAASGAISAPGRVRSR